MKKFIINCFVILCSTLPCVGQTATNFNCNDCSGTNQDLFTHLDAGKVVVIVWVMPCAACINGALTAQTEVQSALASYPGRVLYYLADDVANTNCTTLSSWASTNGITQSINISNTKVDMSAYGEAGMPKVVVIGGGSTHKVFYNQNAPDITAEGIKDAITAAFAGVPSSLKNPAANNLFVGIYPNPSNFVLNVSINVPQDSKIKIEVLNSLGQVTKSIYHGDLSNGRHNFELNTLELANGNYYINFSDGVKTVTEKIIVNH